jgi:hypothetical protein
LKLVSGRWTLETGRWTPDFLTLVFLIKRAPYRVAELVEATRMKIPNI